MVQTSKTLTVKSIDVEERIINFEVGEAKCFDNPEQINSYFEMSCYAQQLETKLALANEIIDELTEVAEVHLDDTFEKINKLRHDKK